MLEVQIKGLDTAQMRLTALAQKIASKIIRDAMREAVKPMAELAKQLAPDDPLGTAAERSKYKWRGKPYPKPGTLRKTIIARRRNRLSNAFKDVWMIQSRKDLKTAVAPYANLVEGTPGYEGYQFMRRAFAAKQQEVIAIFERELSAGIERNW